MVAVLTAADIPGDNNCGPLLHDDPILASDELRYVGQPVFAVIATDRELARRAATLWNEVDALLVPTTTGHPRFAEVRADPIGVNTRLRSEEHTSELQSH